MLPKKVRDIFSKSGGFSALQEKNVKEQVFSRKDVRKTGFRVVKLVEWNVPVLKFFADDNAVYCLYVNSKLPSKFINDSIELVYR